MKEIFERLQVSACGIKRWIRQHMTCAVLLKSENNISLRKVKRVRTRGGGKIGKVQEPFAVLGSTPNGPNVLIL